MKANKFLLESITVGLREVRQGLNRLAVYQDPVTRSCLAPMGRLATSLRPSRRTQAKPRHRIFIVEDDPAFREELRQFLNRAGDLTVCGTTGALDQALPAIARTKPELVLVDTGIPGKSGLKLIKDLRAADRSVKLLAISRQSGSLHAARVLRSGGDGCITRQDDLDEIIYAIHDILNRRIYVSEEVMENAPGQRRMAAIPAR